MEEGEPGGPNRALQKGVQVLLDHDDPVRVQLRGALHAVVDILCTPPAEVRLTGVHRMGHKIDQVEAVLVKAFEPQALPSLGQVVAGDPVHRRHYSAKEIVGAESFRVEESPLAWIATIVRGGLGDE